jgi:predicted enzyme related to lactoylglutathione lyase
MSENHRPHVGVWFEIPATDLPLAVRFYEALLGTTTTTETMGPMKMAVLAYSKPNISGAIIQGPNYQPGSVGPVIYLNADGILDAALSRVEPLGGKIATPKVELPGDMGAFAHILDTEGNRVGLHAVV